MTNAKPDVVQAEALPPFVIERLAAAFTLHRLDQAEDRARFIAETAALVRGMAVDGAADAALIAAYPKLEIISANSVGVDGIDLEAAKARGVTVTNTPGVLTDCVADLALALVLAVTRRVVEGDSFVRAGRWVESGFPLAWGLQDKVLGIVGLGRIGRAVARRAQAFGMSIAYHGRQAQDDVDFPYHGEAAALAAASDVMVVACPGGQETRHMIDRPVLEALGPEGVLVNVARGSVVDTEALIAALQQGTIRGAGLDVFEDEPRVPEALFALDNVILQPHRGSATVETRKAMGDLLVDNLERHFAGQPVLTPVL
jgi:lactate dehydrogenase-like 2-hydroxyacid dehydrogenase